MREGEKDMCRCEIKQMLADGCGTWLSECQCDRFAKTPEGVVDESGLNVQKC